MDNLSIEFYNESNGAVRVTWDPGMILPNNPQLKQRFDVLLFGCFALRQLRNLGQQPVTDELARGLSMWAPARVATSSSSGTPAGSIVASPHHVLHGAAVLMGMSRQDADTKYGDPLWLVPYSGPGKRRFVGRLDMAGRGQLQFYLDAKGFGLGLILGQDMNRYAPDSVLLLLSYLTQLYGDDARVMGGLEGVARECAELYKAGAIQPLLLEAQAVKLLERHLPARG